MNLIYYTSGINGVGRLVFGISIFNGLKVHSIDDVCSVIKNNEIEIVIIAVPTKMAQEVIDVFVKCGVRAFLNFAQVTIKVPENVLVKNENMSIELEALSYYLTREKN